MEMSLGISTSRYINFATRTSNRLEIFITRKEREKKLRGRVVCECDPSFGYRVAQQRLLTKFPG